MRMIHIVIAATVFCGGASAKDAVPYKTEDCGKYSVQMDMNTCAGGNYEAADAALNAIYGQVMASRADAAARNGLKQAERIWIKSRDTACNDAVGSQADGGSIWPMEMSDCLRGKTDARIRVLRRMLICKAGASACDPH